MQIKFFRIFFLYIIIILVRGLFLHRINWNIKAHFIIRPLTLMLYPVFYNINLTNTKLISIEKKNTHTKKYGLCIKCILKLLKLTFIVYFTSKYNNKIYSVMIKIQIFKFILSLKMNFLNLNFYII